jgi:hypothetical protein
LLENWLCFDIHSFNMRSAIILALSAAVTARPQFDALIGGLLSMSL